MDISPPSDVLGITSFGPVSGSPLIPPEVLTYYFIVFFILLLGVYFIIHHKRQSASFRYKIKLLFITALLIKIFVVVGGGILISYWLIPTPTVLQTKPLPGSGDFPTTQKIEILFDRPVDRSELQKTITPETPGFWMFEDSFYTTHLYRKLVFIPTQSLKPDTSYQVQLTNIKSLVSLSQSTNYIFDFKTQPTPKVQSVTPPDQTNQVDIQAPIKVNLTFPNLQASQFDFELSPTHPLKISLNDSKKAYTLTPVEPFKQGVKYQLVIKKTDLIFNLPTNTILEQSPTTNEYLGEFTTKEAPGITKFTPTSSNVSLTDQISITFSQAMDRDSVEENFSLAPQTPGSLNWIDDSTLNFKPQKLNYDTSYTVTIKQGAKAKVSGFLEADIIKSFSTIGAVKVASFSPNNGWLAASIDSPIRVSFDQAVDKNSAQSKFSLTPETSGSFSWQGNTLVFTPSKKLPFSTKFTVNIASGVKTTKGLDSNIQFTSIFTTQEQTVKLAVPVWLQKHTLSCELAALKMALNFRGVTVSEETLLAAVGVDSTPHQGDIWGNPNNAFVGNVDGSQMKDGYGVHWGPIARVAKTYRGASEFSGWNIGQLTEVIAQGNPVVIWVYAGGGSPTTWKTPDGQVINAARDEHAVTAVGFVGPAQNPSQLVINDPLYGQVYWTRAVFNKKWAIFNNSGVVVY